MESGKRTHGGGQRTLGRREHKTGNEGTEYREGCTNGEHYLKVSAS